MSRAAEDGAGGDEGARRVEYASAMIDVSPDDVVEVAALRRAFVDARDEDHDLAPEADAPAPRPDAAVDADVNVREARRMRRKKRWRQVLLVVLLTLWGLKILVWGLL